MMAVRRHRQVVFLDLDMTLQLERTPMGTTEHSDLLALQKARQRLLLYPVFLFPWHILSPFMLQRIPKEVPRNSFSRGHVGKKIGNSLEMPPRTCVLNLRNAQEWPMLKNPLDLSLDRL